MISLNERHIDFIVKDLHSRGLILEGLDNEVIDHVCSAVEERMHRGKLFAEAYKEVLKSFGNTEGIQDTQHQIIETHHRKPITMLRNHLTIAWRNLKKHSFYSFINIAGLAIGIAACIIISLFIVDELAYDSYNTKADRIYRIEADVKFAGNEFRMAYRSAPEAQILTQDYPEVEAAVRFRDYSPYLVRADGATENSKEKNVMWTDSTFFNIFTVNIIEGSAARALTQPETMAISRKMAGKYFPGKSAVGQRMVLDNKYDFEVVAVYEDIPAASHFHFDILLALLGTKPPAIEARSTNFISENFQTYILLREGSDARAFEKKLPDFLQKHLGPELANAMGSEMTIEKFKASGNRYELSLRPLKDIHLHSDVRGEFEPNGNITYVYLLGTVAVFILAIACINFMNLSTARSSNRAREVGVRKVMGSMRFHLIRQFLTESVLVTLFAFALSLVLAYLFLPVFNILSLKDLHLPFAQPLFYVILVASACVIGLMAGVYPSFFLSAFKPVNVLKGKVALGMKSGFIRSTLVVFQFVVSVFLIIGAIAVNRQLNFIQNKKLGFEKDQVIVIHDPYAIRPNVQAFKDEITKLSSIENGTISGYVPVDFGARNHSPYWKEGVQPTPDNMVGFQSWYVDHDYVKTLKLQVIQGRDFSLDFPSDSSAVILNKTAAERFGFGDDAVGRKITSFNDEKHLDLDHIQSWTVVGVVDDFHFSSMKENIAPLGLFIGNSDGSVCFRFKPEQTTAVIASIEKVWKKFAPAEPFQYSFLDEDFGQMYQAEERLGKVFMIFAGLAIVIACLGLFALTAFTAEQRTKEIGIRKVLGASSGSIVMLLSKDLSKLILIAFVISAPLSWYAVNWWLESYRYKTEIGAFVYLVAGAVAFIIAVATMSYQSIRAANLDPVDSLKSE